MRKLTFIYICVIIEVMLFSSYRALGHGDIFTENLDEWYMTDPPEMDSAEWSTANHDTAHEWEVFQVRTRAKVRLHKEIDGLADFPEEMRGPVEKAVDNGTIKSIKVQDGWIVSSDRGEFPGGGQWWFSFDGKIQYKLSDICVVNFHDTKNGLIGVQPLPAYQGRLIRYVRAADGKWEISPVKVFGDLPSVSTMLGDGSILVVTDRRLIKISNDFKKSDILLDRMFWGGLYPNSIIAMNNGDIFIGMRRGVAKIWKNEQGFTVKWLAPSKQFAELIDKTEGFK